MRNPIRKLALLVLSASLIGCSFEDAVENFVPDDELAFAKQHIALYRIGNLDEIMGQVDPQVIKDEDVDAISTIVGLFPSMDFEDEIVVGYNRHVNTSGTSAALTFQYQYPDTWLLVAVNIRSADDAFVVTGFNVQSLNQSLEAMNAFCANKHGLLGYLFLLLGIVVPLTCIVSFIYCLRTPIPKRKWLWAIFTLLGFGAVSINWTTGQTGYSMFSIQLLGAGFIRSGLYGPWVLSFAAPLGAVVFWTRRKEWMQANQQGEGDSE